MGLGRQSVLMMRKERRQSKRQSAAAALSGRGLGGRRNDHSCGADLLACFDASK